MVSSSARPGAAFLPISAVVADANPYARSFIAAVLRRAGVATVRPVADGAAVVEALEAGRPGLLILDWDVGVVPGREVVRLVRGEGGPGPVPVVVTMAEPTRSAVEAAVAEGVGSILAKPLSAFRLGQRIRAAVGSRPDA